MKGAEFRELIRSETIAMPGVFNAITARMAQQVGFRAAYLSGAGVTNSLTAFPDIGLLTLTEMAQQARYVTAAVDLPVIADADTGYGEALSIARAVHDFENAGLAGIHLEDQVAPKRCGHLEGKRIVPASEMCARILAAVRARRHQSFFLIARTDARLVEGLDAAVERANAYLNAGADAIFPESLASEEEFANFASRVSAPLLANITEFGKTPLIPVSRLAELGYAMVIFPMSAFRMMMRACEECFSAIMQEGSQAAMVNRMQTRNELYELIDYPKYNRFDSEIAAETGLT
ncbi:MAG TPA: methylisocitrate lyase [Chthonomonadales bacterium]|nr:methylisocitrate lyase [Chthonomonadales bacterium]